MDILVLNNNVCPTLSHRHDRLFNLNVNLIKNGWKCGMCPAMSVEEYVVVEIRLLLLMCRWWTVLPLRHKKCCSFVYSGIECFYCSTTMWAETNWDPSPQGAFCISKDKKFVEVRAATFNPSMISALLGGRCPGAVIKAFLITFTTVVVLFWSSTIYHNKLGWRHALDIFLQ